jgi:hypothetical protein
MGKAADDSVLDAGLNVVKTTATQLCLCAGQPVTYAEATATKMLVLKTGLTSGSFTGPVDDTSGRKLSKTAEVGVPVTNTGTADHAALCSGTVLLYVTQIVPSQVVTAGNTANTPIFKIAFPDPV